MRPQNPEEKTQQQEGTTRNKIKIFKFRLRLRITPLYKDARGYLPVDDAEAPENGEYSEPGSIDSARTDRSWVSGSVRRLLAVVAARGSGEWARARAGEADGDRGEHNDGKHTRADECSGVLGQHHARSQADFGQRDQ
jgi:hypothetical protein